MMKKLVINTTKYNFKWSPRNVDESTRTVPDLVLSMAEIYRKYLVTGDISSLPGKVRPTMYDEGDEFDDSFESEEMTDSLLRARELRDSASNTIKTQTTERTRQPDNGPSGQEDKPQNDEGANAPSTKPPITQVPSNPAHDEEPRDKE